ncbi:hypothetical protein BDR03DRAFT_1014062 [Suillus americanus]|nr:hypothetical protein BDR03DRAFT_1014062 [Suillus americanus]
MSTPVDNSLTNLKASTGQIMAIISAARQIPLGPSHLTLGKEVATLVADVVKEYGSGSGSGPLPGLIISCSKELLRIQNMVPKVWPDWHSIGYDDPRILRHAWYPKALAWKALGDPTFDLPTAAPLSTGLIPVNLPSPAIPSGNVTGPSTNPTTESWDKGKGKAIFPNPEPEAEGSKKRKSPLISGLSSQPPKSAMKSHKHQRSARLVKSKCIVESEDDEDSVIQPLSRGVLEVVLPWLSTIVARTPNSPHSTRALTKKPFGPARVIAGSHPAVIEPSQPTPKPPVHEPPVMPVVDILIPDPVKQPMLCLPQAQLALCNSVGQEDQGFIYIVRLLHNKEDQVHPHPHEYGIPTSSHSCSLYPPEDEVNDTIRRSLQNFLRGSYTSQTPGPSTAPPASKSKAKLTTHGHNKTITAVKPPAPAPAPASLPSSRSAVPAAALGVPMPDLHAMSHAIRDAAAQIALFEAHVAEQNGKIDTLQCLHEGLRCKIIDWHPSFPLPDTPANATSLLLDQSSPHTIMETLAPTTATPTFPDASAIEGLLFDYDQVVHPEDRDASGDIVDPGDPSNLVPEYDSSNNMDVEMVVKGEESSEEVDMAT